MAHYDTDSLKTKSDEELCRMLFEADLEIERFDREIESATSRRDAARDTKEAVRAAVSSKGALPPRTRLVLENPRASGTCLLFDIQRDQPATITYTQMPYHKADRK